MMTREEVTAYLDKMAAARKQLISPPNTEIGFFENDIWPIETEPKVFMNGVREICHILGFPVKYELRYGCTHNETFGWASVLYWNGIKFFDLATRTDNGWTN